MKIEMTPKLKPRRGGEVKIGNVYTNDHSKHYYKIVVGMIEQNRGHGSWNNVICIHISGTGDVIGCSRNPQNYISNHQDLVGLVQDMPTLKIEWFKE